MIIFPVLLWGLIAFAAVIGASAISLLLYGIVGADRDGYAMLQYLSGFAEPHKLVTRTLFLGLYAYASLLYIKKRHELTWGVRWSCLLCQVLSFYIFMTGLIKGYDLTWSLSTVVYSGIPIYLMWLMFSLNKNHKSLFFWFISIQIFLSVLVLLFPAFSFLDGGRYKLLEGVYVIEGGGLNYSVPDASFVKGSIGRYGIFHNPNALGLYACVALACGFSIMSERGKVQKSVGVGLLLFGGVCWLNSLTRGPMLFLIVGIALSMLLPAKNLSHQVGAQRTKSVLSILALLCLLIIGFFSTNIASYLIPSAGTDSVYDRYEGYLYGFEAVMNYPILGVDEKWDWGVKSYPHFLALSFAADYGLLAGLMITILVFIWGGRLILIGVRRFRNMESRSEAVLAVLLILACWGIAVTNNFAAPVLFWLAMSEAVILLRVKGNRSHA